MAERVGFEPTVLSHTAFRERHHQPLGHLSAAEDSKARPEPGRACARRATAVREPSGAPRPGARCRWRAPELGRFLGEDARHDPQPPGPPGRGSASWSAEPQAPSLGSARATRRRPRRPRGRRPAHMTHGSITQNSSRPRASGRPRRSRRLADGAHHRVRGRVAGRAPVSGLPCATIASSMTATAPSAALAGRRRRGGLGQRCAHVQLVVHTPMRPRRPRRCTSAVGRLRTRHGARGSPGRATICRASRRTPGRGRRCSRPASRIEEHHGRHTDASAS